MKRSTDRMLTTHTGSLPRTPTVLDPDMMRIHLRWGADEAPQTGTCRSKPSWT